jgi:hypothetical protein
MVSKPAGKILDIASTNEHVYVLVTSDDQRPENFTLWRSSDPSSKAWEYVNMGIEAAGYTIQGIYGNESRLFISCLLKGVTEDWLNYALFYTDATLDSFKLLASNTQYLTGVAADDYTPGSTFFLGTAGTGVYKIAWEPLGTPLTPAADVVSGTEWLNIAGISNLGDRIISDTTVENPGSEIAAVARNGFLYEIKSGEARGTVFRAAKWTRALSLWQDPGDASRRILLVNLEGSYSTYGYGEVPLVFSSGVFELGTGHVTCATPGQGGTTPYTDTGDYENTIGKYSINQMMQAPSAIDSRMLLFAATVQDGLWSYKLRTDGWQWNMEE